jgi:hypothetical protein
LLIELDQGGRFCASLAPDQMPTATGLLERDYQFEFCSDHGPYAIRASTGGESCGF